MCWPLRRSRHRGVSDYLSERHSADPPPPAAPLQAGQDPSAAGANGVVRGAARRASASRSTAASAVGSGSGPSGVGFQHRRPLPCPVRRCYADHQPGPSAAAPPAGGRCCAVGLPSSRAAAHGVGLPGRRTEPAGGPRKKIPSAKYPSCASRTGRRSLPSGDSLGGHSGRPPTRAAAHAATASAPSADAWARPHPRTPRRQKILASVLRRDPAPR